ncbi:two-component system response regulator DesR [Neomicrococcus aestuarii]|uniref:Two-component system response regulator DesR n=2 Tax=Neomicrococcus aestuarii TaxID=556325 RepID=A0A7W8WZ43_9MICC|nr:response regulator transcription factor [Neomicrococcus aestuarii]MBB5512961.1 two-component system response regulator DesR [Neomicrococcus aestuarii]
MVTGDGVVAEGRAQIRVLIADDQALVRGAMAALLNLEPDIDVIAEVGDGTAALAALREQQVDVCLLDVQMPGMDGIETAERIRTEQPHVRVLMVTTFDRPGYLKRALAAGASGFVVKDTPADQLAEVVRRIHSGLRVVDPHLAQESLFEGDNPLTEREVEILLRAADGEPVAKIAAALYLSAGTVRNYLSNAIAKTCTTNRIEAARTARDRGWI